MNRWSLACLVVAFVSQVARPDQTAAPDLKAASTSSKRQVDDSIRIEGVVTFVEPKWHTLFVQRGGEGFFVQLADVIFPDLRRGDLVEVTGRRTAPSSRALRGATIRKLEQRRALPSAVDLDTAELPLHYYDACWTSVSGWVFRYVARDHKYQYLRIASLTSPIRVVIPIDAVGSETKWVGRHVRVTGVILNKKTNLEFFASSATFDEVEQPAAARGVVMAVEGNVVAISDQLRGLYYASLPDVSSVRPGDFVEVQGAVSPSEIGNRFKRVEHASVKPLGRAELSSPRASPLDGAENHLGQLTQFVGTVADSSIHDGLLRVELKANGSSLKLSGLVESDTIHVEPGQLVQVTGLLEPTGEKDEGYFMPVISVQTLGTQEADNRPLIALLAAIAGGGLFLFFTWHKRGADQENFQRVVNERLAEISHVGRLDLLADMVGALAHQLNQPLTSVCSFARAAQIIRKNAPDSKELDVCLDQIYDEGMRAGNIIRRIRALSRPRTDRRVKTDINQVVEDVVEIFQLQSAVSGNLVKLELDPNLERAKIDEVQIQQVLLNLLNNARDATAESSVGTPRIEVTTKMIGQDIEISVRDNGPGMATNDMSRAFGRYFTTKSDGCGLGLSISKAIVESHHGQITAQRVNPQGGTCVRFTLPTAVVDDSSIGPPTITGVIENRAGQIAAGSTARP